jgi:hypothetical protein
MQKIDPLPESDNEDKGNETWNVSERNSTRLRTTDYPSTLCLQQI